MRSCLAMIIGAILLAAPVAAETITLDAVDGGWYSSSGFHSPDNPSIAVSKGSLSPLGDLRNWLLFDLASVTGSIQSARLTLGTGLVHFTTDLSDPPVTPIEYTLFDVDTAFSTLTGGGFDLTSVYEDLGAGTVLGTRNYVRADQGQVVSIFLNQAAIAGLQASTGGQFAIGGAITSSTLPSRDRWIGFDSPITRQLTIEVPEPSTLLLLASAALITVRRRNGTGTL